MQDNSAENSATLPAEKQAVPGQQKPAGRSVELPRSTQPYRIEWINAISVAVVHLLALTAVLPWLFSWTGVALSIGGIYVFGTLGINLAYHRLLTHRGLVVPRWLEQTFAVLGVCCLQGTPARWAATHRLHHQYSDEQEDPHSPLISFLWGHFTWLFILNRDLDEINHYERYARDILRQPFYLRIERKFLWFWMYVAHAVLFFAAGLACGWIQSGDYFTGLQFGLSVLIWGVFVRTVFVWHITWSVNSLSHIWGYQTYPTGDHSRNNWLVGLLAMGEGWHNNHHHDQRCAAHGRRWWELDVTYLTIKLLKRVRLARNVIEPGRLEK